METLGKYEKNEVRVVLSGEILDLGGRNFLQASGMLVSPYPEPERGQNGVLDIASENDKIGTFTVLFDEEKNMPSKYYSPSLRSLNQEGVSHGIHRSDW